jgi:hypothetical protein
MVKLLEFDSDVGPVLFEVRAAPGEVVPIGRTSEMIEKIAESMGQVLGIVSGVARGFAAAVADSPADTAQLEFGLQFTAKGRLYVVESEGQAAIKVTLTMSPGSYATQTS